MTDQKEFQSISEIGVIRDQKQVLNAQDLAFQIGGANPLGGVTLAHFDNVEGLRLGYLLIQQTNRFLAEYESIPFSEESATHFQSQYHLFIDQLDLLGGQLQPIEFNRLKQAFRGSLFKFIRQSVAVSRALAKPYGYPGDYELLQNLYDGRSSSVSNVGKYYDYMFLNDPLSVAVLDRVAAMSQRLEKFLSENTLSEVNILNIASGSGFELIPIAKKAYPFKINYYCFDQEVASLIYAKQAVSAVNQSINFIFIQDDIRNFFRGNGKNQKFDFIYNIGLADYLPDRILKALMQQSIESLEDKGTFVIAHKDYTKFPSRYPSWSCDWNFIERSKGAYEEFVAREITGYKSYLSFFESTREVIYFGEFAK
jgi:SAM-dependent methyltransferase